VDDDIVTRLRQIPTAWPLVREAADEIEDLRFQLSGTQGELESALSRERTLLRDQEDCRIGADNLQAEIERLLMNTGCARNQFSTQFCAEALDAQREIERLREELDEARRAIITLLAGTDIGTMHRLADERGWTCFHDNAARRSTAPTPANTGGGADHQIPEAL